MEEKVKGSTNIEMKSAGEIPLEQVLEKKLQDAKIETNQQIQGALVAAFGIFASVVSFLTVEFQFLKTINNLQQIIGFSLVLFALLLGFNIALNYLANSQLNDKISTHNKYLIMAIAGMFFFGLIFVFWGNNESVKENKIGQKELCVFDNKLNDLQLRCDQKIEICNMRLKLLEKTILQDKQEAKYGICNNNQKTLQ